ncbi:aromatic compound dioxygenase [Cylindrobasidium torrendii FP15055 ss-10]|uniref:Aromatic compound dioxygenase n=1 Tax=Cylindrobasidium torrendii FP15055 ss-10 TaxID=1314674 RepID=A0A0D7BPA6_9AGAR|nr:aromatic compound dioxygenase [Cylindrobasidium torrendii FP15055 ss-10]
MILSGSMTALVFLLAAGSGAAHKSATTPEEIETQRALQAASYHCAPAVAAYTAQRKRDWARKVLGDRGVSPEIGPGAQAAARVQASIEEYDELFGKSSGSTSAELMSCSPMETNARLDNNTCVLAPVVTEGPYYHKEGHPIRNNMAELQQGLLLLLDVGVIDVETCEPMEGVLVDLWHANATGHYAGHPWPKPELKDEKPQVGGKRAGLLSAFPRTEYEETWLRGAWPTNRNGVAQFTTIFPGYYTGRATHVHTKVFQDWQPTDNGSFTGGRLMHVGQFFFDDEVNSVIDKMHPYTTNELKDRTRNWRDSLNIFEDSHGPEGQYNPVFRLEFLGGVINQGLAGFITMGINGSANVDNFWKG